MCSAATNVLAGGRERLGESDLAGLNTTGVTFSCWEKTIYTLIFFFVLERMEGLGVGVGG